MLIDFQWLSSQILQKNISYCAQMLVMKAVLWIRIQTRMDPELLPGSASGARSGIIVPDPDPAKQERAYK